MTTARAIATRTLFLAAVGATRFVPGLDAYGSATRVTAGPASA